MSRRSTRQRRSARRRRAIYALSPVARRYAYLDVKACRRHALESWARLQEAWVDPFLERVFAVLRARGHRL